MSDFFSKALKYIKNPKYRVTINSSLGLYNYMSDEAFLKKVFPVHVGYKLDLSNPQTYNAKIQWLKLNDRKDFYVNLVDKYEAKRIVGNVIGNEYLIPTLGVWDSFSDIDFNELPNQFVLKCTHDSGGIVICKDKASFNYLQAKKKIESSLKRNYFMLGREWPYKMVRPRIIAEKYIEDTKIGELIDYKFFTFGGKVKALFVATDRQTPGVETKFDFFDENYQSLDIINGHPKSEVLPAKPNNFELMKQLAETISKDLIHARIDFYEVNNHVFFGEVTLYHWSGFTPFYPEKWDSIFGSWIKLPIDE